MKIQELAQLWNMSEDEIITMMKTVIGEDASLEDMEAAVMEVMSNLQAALDQQLTVQECLSYLNLIDLKEIMKALHVNDYQKMTKEEILQYLQETFTKPGYMEKVYPWLSNGEVEMLKQLCITAIPLVSTDILFYVSELMRHGLCYMDELGKHLIIPEELKTEFLYAQINPSLQAKQKENASIYDICNAAVYFGGVCPLSTLQMYIQQATGNRMTEQDLVQWHKASALNREEFFFKNGYIISSSLQETPEDIVALQQLQKMKKQFFWPNQEQLLMLSMEQWSIDDEVYSDFWDLAPYMMENEFGDIMSVSRFVEASIRTGAPFDALMGFLSEQIFSFDTDEQIDSFIQIMQTLWNNTPMWENCGYSINQVKAGIPQKVTEQKQEPTKGKIISLAEHRAKKNS